VDAHTLVIRLKAPDYNLSYILAMPPTSALAREVAEQYGTALAEHPIGTGPFRLKEWRRSSRVTLEANPDFREEYFESIGGSGKNDAAIATHLKGKRLPLVKLVQVDIIDEDQPRWLAFLSAEHDYIRPVPPPLADAALPGGKLAPNLVAKGVTRTPDELAWLTYTTFNMEDKTIGGYTPERIALRRAMSMAFPVQDEIAIIEKGQAEEAWSPIARGMTGFIDERASFHEYNPASAKALLDTYGFIDRDGDGWREMPDGSPLVVEYASVPDQRERSRNELWGRAMERIGIRMTFNRIEKLPEIRKLATLGKIPMFSYGWIADYPDGENFLQLFWSKSIGGTNYTLFSHPEFDAMYVRIKTMPDSPERTALYQKMVHILWVYNPWRVNTLKQGTALMHPWVLGYKKHPFAHEPWRYLDIDTNKLPPELRK
jgi:ABC-type transport system substrate-binding protein